MEKTIKIQPYYRFNGEGAEHCFACATDAVCGGTSLPTQFVHIVQISSEAFRCASCGKVIPMYTEKL